MSQGSLLTMLVTRQLHIWLLIIFKFRDKRAEKWVTSQGEGQGEEEEQMITEENPGEEKLIVGVCCSVPQDFIHCIERQQSVPVHARMSHCIGMLASGTQQLTALTSVNKLIASD